MDASEKIKAMSGFRKRASGPVDPALEGEEKLRAEMKRNRAINRKTAAATSGVGSTGRSGGDVALATARPRDPLFYWRQNNLPYDFSDPDELRRVRLYCRLLYLTHPMIASCIDIYSKFPLLGMELTCKDEKLTEFYTDLFFDEDGLNYREFLVDVGREMWTCGEAWPFATFNEQLGIWDSEELINADDVEVQRSPFMEGLRLFIKLPEPIRRVLRERQPAWEYEKLMEGYPELVHYSAEDKYMPVSNVLLRQIKFKADTFNPRGVPILTRAMRAIIQEEMLNSAMDSIADRLYTPLILVKLGATAADMGMDQPWIPTDDDLSDFMESLDIALAADFRAIVHHFAVDIEPVFGREQMPDLTADFERLEDRILQTFGLSKTMLTGAGEGQTYAADALNRDLVAQLMTSYQNKIANHYRARAKIVAEAQEHYDYEERNGKRYVITEEILETDEETGEERIVEQPKLLIPEIVFKTLNLRDEEVERQFLESLVEAGIPISMKTRLTNMPIEFDDEVERKKDEQVLLAVKEQETRKEQYQALRDANLPIPQDLRNDFEPRPMNQPNPDAMALRTPVLGLDPTLMYPNVAPSPEDLAQVPVGQPVPSFPQAQMPGTPVIPMGQDQQMGEEESQRPAESDEQRGKMPKSSKAQLWRDAKRMRSLSDDHAATEDLGDPVLHGYGTPRHLGMRRHVPLDDLPGMEYAPRED